MNPIVKHERSKSLNFQNKKEEGERNKLIEKIAITLKMKLSKLFKYFNYEVRDLIIDLSRIIRLSNTPFEIYLREIEKSIIDKISKNNKQQQNDLNKNINLEAKKVNSPNHLNSNKLPNHKKNVKSFDNLKDRVGITMDLEKLKNKINNSHLLENKPSEKSTVKLEEIKIKKEDEWAKLAKYNYNKYEEELHNTKIKEEEKKKQMREILAKQILEKQSFFHKEKEIEKNNFQKYQEILIKQDLNEKLKIEKIKNKIKNEKEIRDKIIIESNLIKKKEEEIENREELIFLENLKKNKDLEEEKINKKKIQERDMYKRMISENDSRLTQKREEKKKEELENVKALNEYSKLIEKQEADRINQNQMRLDRTKNLIEKFGESIKIDEHKLKIKEEKQFMKELREKDLREFQKDKEEKERKKLLNIQLKNTLDRQIKEKKVIMNDLINQDRKYDKEIISELEKYNTEKDKILNEHREKAKKYNEDLTLQVNEKIKYKIPSMDEKEKLINKIDEILNNK